MKDLVRPLCKKHRFRTAFESQLVRVPNPCKFMNRALSSCFSITLREPHLKNISLSDMLNLRDVSLQIDYQWQVFFSRFRELFVADSIEIIFKTKNFCSFFFHFWNLVQILNILKKKMIVIAVLLRNLQAVKDLVRLLSQKHCFRIPFDSQNIKRSQTLVKGEWEHLHHIFPSLW